MRSLLALAVACGCFPLALPASHPAEPTEKIATFSIAAIDPETGTCGGAVASMYPGVGKVVVFARPDVGVFCTQHYGKTRWGKPALDLLEKGKLPEEVLSALLREDKEPGGRQLA